jgi:hypothetical protein
VFVEAQPHGNIKDDIGVGTGALVADEAQPANV